MEVLPRRPYHCFNDQVVLIGNRARKPHAFAVDLIDFISRSVLGKAYTVRMLCIGLDQLCASFSKFMVYMLDGNRIEQIICFDRRFLKATGSEDDCDRASGNDRMLRCCCKPVEKAVMC